METNRIRVAAVSYTNTIPFIYGLTHFPDISQRSELILLPPAGCADAFYNGDADIALVPVGAMRPGDLEKLCCSWCLGAEGAVDSVLLLTDKPVKELKTIYLDIESRTSVLLVKILCRWLWGISPAFLPLSDHRTFVPGTNEGVLMIGDKSFEARSRFWYSYDLAEAWYKLTGLPAVFACWLTSDRIDEVYKEKFNHALGWGIDHLEDAISTLSGNSSLTTDQIRHYLTNCISFQLDKRKHSAIRAFQKYCSEL